MQPYPSKVKLRFQLTLPSMNLPKDFLTGEKAPFIVTLFVAALSWTAIRTADRLAGTPFIEYRISESQSENKRPGMELRLRNITPASRFDCFRLTIAARQLETLRFGDPKEQRHRIRGTVLSLLTATRSKDTEWEIRATNLAPGADIEIFIPTVGIGTPLVLVQPCAIQAEEESEPVKGIEVKKEKEGTKADAPVIIAWGPTTMFVEYEIAILWSALLLWLLLIWPSTRGRSASNCKTDGFDEMEGG